MVQFSKDTHEKLLRLRELRALIQMLGDNTEDEIYDEYRKLLRPLVEELLPLVQLIAQAGLLTASGKDDDGDYIQKRWDSVHFEVTDAFENGNIWLDAESVCGAAFREQPHSEDGKPNQGLRDQDAQK